MTADAMLAIDLDWADWPTWLGADLTYRFGPLAGLAPTGGTKRKWSWRVCYRAAIDHSELPIVPRTVLRVLLDRTTDQDNGPPAPTVPPMSSKDIGDRVPCDPDHVLRAQRVLEAAGWLGIIPRPGQVPILTLMVPVDRPPELLRPRQTPAPRAGVTPAPRAGPPAPRAGDPRATRGTLETGDRETLGDPRVNSDDSDRRAAPAPVGIDVASMWERARTKIVGPR